MGVGSMRRYGRRLAPGMRSRTFNRWLLWLLPLLVARLFVPAGFMVSATPNGLDLMLCPAYAPLPASAADAARAHHMAGMDHASHAMHDSAGHHASHQDSTDHELSQSLCPFAVGGGAALVPVVSTVDHVYSPIGPALSFRDTPARISPTVLIDRIRGPPLV